MERRVPYKGKSRKKKRNSQYRNMAEDLVWEWWKKQVDVIELLSAGVLQLLLPTGTPNKASAQSLAAPTLTVHPLPPCPKW
jgi:hypothetical protein